MLQEISVLLGTDIGPYKLSSVLEYGEWEAVFLAHKVPLDIQVVVKVLFPPALDKESLSSWTKQFQHRAQQLTQLQHDAILSLQDYGMHNGLAYTVRLHEDGETLQDIVQHRVPMNLSETLTIVDQLAKALDFAHEHGFVHRHLQASNVLLISQDQFALTDFALEVPTTADVNADIFALGVVLYQMVTGCLPQDPPLPPHQLVTDLFNEVEHVLLRALSPHHEERYATAQQLADAFSIALMEMLMQRSSSFRTTSPLAPSMSMLSSTLHVENVPPPTQVRQPLAQSTSSSERVGSKTSFAWSRAIGSNAFLVAGLTILVVSVVFLSALGFLALHARARNAAHSVSLHTRDTSILFSDSLSQNDTGWPLTSETAFWDHAYHVTNIANAPVAVILSTQSFKSNIAYSLSMREVRGDDTTTDNAFGLIFCYREQMHGIQHTMSFYSFEVVNRQNGEYRFWEYDDNEQAVQANVGGWTLLWHHTFGNEFHYGQSMNTFAIVSMNATFTFTVNGQQVAVVHNGLLSGGRLVCRLHN